MSNLKMLIFFILMGIVTIPSFSWYGMPTPFLHVEGNQLKDPDGKTVVLRGGWMQPTETWFNGGGRWYRNPTDYTSPDNVAPMLNYLNEAATLMSDPTPRYGRNHGWYNTFVRMNTDAIGGWTQQGGQVNQAQFDGWIQNFLVPYANHLKTRGLYLILSATGPVNTPNNGERNAGITERARLRTFWTTVASAPGVKNADNLLFELMNEPVQIESAPGNGDWGMGQAKYYEAFRNWIQPVIDDVRKTGANNVVYVPTLEWQGSPQQHIQYPFTGTNVGVAVHYYPAYGNCRDNVTCHNNLWNRQYKPVAERWPMIITENFWFPEDDGLVDGSTANYGNTLKANIDAAGNVSYMIGFLSDLIDVNSARPENASLLTKEGAQAAFDWWYGYNGGSGCVPTVITPYIQVNDGAWQQVSSITVSSGAKVEFGPQPLSGGSWSWSGCGTTGAAREQTIFPAGTCTATATYTNDCGTLTKQIINIAVSYNGIYSFIARHSGKAVNVVGGGTSDGTNIGQWPYSELNDNVHFKVTHLVNGWHKISPVIDTLQALDVNGISSNNGANIQTWRWNAANNQQWKFEDAGDGYFRIIARNSDKCLDVADVSSADGANIHQWDCISGAQNQSFLLTERDPGILTALDNPGNISEPADLVKVAIYPNPSTGGNFTVIVPTENKGNYPLSIFTADGKKVYEAKSLGIGSHDIRTDLSQGIYFVKVNGTMQKLIIK